MRTLLLLPLVLACSEQKEVVRYSNPVDGTTQDMRVYRPKTERPDVPGDMVALQQLVLLMPQEELTQRITTKAMVSYVRAMEAAVRAAPQPAGTTGQLLVDVSLAESGPPVFAYAMRPPPPTGELVRLVNLELVKIEKPAVTGTVHFQVFFRVGPAGK